MGEHEAAHPSAQGGVELREGFIQQQRRRFGQQGAQQRRARPLSAGQGCRGLFTQPSQIGLAQRCGNPPPPFVTTQAAGQTKGQILRHAQMGKQQRILKKNTDAALFRRQSIQSPRAQRHRAHSAKRRWQDAAQVAEQG